MLVDDANLEQKSIRSIQKKKKRNVRTEVHVGIITYTTFEKKIFKVDIEKMFKINKKYQELGNESY